MRTDRSIRAALLRPLWDYLARVTERTDAQARAAGLTVEVGPGGVRRYRDPRMDQLAAGRRPAPYTGVRPVIEPMASDWSTPTLTVSASPAGAGWSR